MNLFNCYFITIDDYNKVEKRRNEVSKTNFNDLMTEEDKTYLETWKRNNEKTTAKRCAKTQLRSKTKKQAIGKATVDNRSNIPLNFPLGIAPCSEPLASLPTSDPTNNLTSGSANPPVLSAALSDKNLSTAAAIVNPSVSNSVASSTVSFALSSPNYTSNIRPVESVANRNFAPYLPWAVTSSVTSAPESFPITSNSSILSILPLVTPSFNSTDTVQPSVSSTLNSNLQPLAHDLNLSVPNCDNLTYSTFVSGLQPTSETSHTAIDVSSFSLESTNSNTFSFTRPSFDSLEQTEFRVSSPMRSAFQAGFSGEDIFPPRNPSNINHLLPGNVFQERPSTIDQISKKVDNISEKIDAILANQSLIIDCLKNNGFISSNASSTMTPASQKMCTKELTTVELEALNNSKKKGTTNAHFAVILLKTYTTPEERMNCTVYGEGRKSKGLKIETLAKIKKDYEAIYSNESWSDAVNAMNSHLRKYCSSKDK